MWTNDTVEVKLLENDPLEKLSISRRELEVWYYTGILLPEKNLHTKKMIRGDPRWTVSEFKRFEFPEGSVYLDIPNLRVFVEGGGGSVTHLGGYQDYKNGTRVDVEQRNKRILTNKISLNVAHSCNLDCTYCYASKGGYDHDEKLMSKEVAIRAVDFLLNNTNFRQYQILFFGGEPLLNFKVVKSVVDYLSEIKDIDFYFNIVTNGTLCNEDIFHYLHAYNFSTLISIDGPAIIHDSYRPDKFGGPTFDKIIANYNKYFSKLGTVSARMVYTANSLNIYENFDFLRKIGFRDISFRPVITKEDNLSAIRQENFERIACEYFKVFEFIAEQLMKGIIMKSRNLFDPIMQLLLNIRKVVYCEAGQFNTVTPEGSIYPCPYFVYKDKFLFGDIYSGITQQHTYQRFRSICLEEKIPCSNCWAKYLCGGGCRSAALYYYNKLHFRDEFCEIRKKYYEKVIRWLSMKFIENPDMLSRIVKIYLEGILWKS